MSFFAPSCDGKSYFPAGAPIREWRKDIRHEWNSEKRVYEEQGERDCTNTGCSDHPENSGRCPWIESGKKYELLRCDIHKPIGHPDFTYKTEVACKTGNFIVGYADIIFNVKWKLVPVIGVEVPSIGMDRYEELDSDWSKWFLKYAETTFGDQYPQPSLEDFLSDEFSPFNCSVLVEAKPDLNDVGSVIRQLKTYYDILTRSSYDIKKMVIVTYTEVDKKYVSLLENEGITCITVSEDGRV
jgi:hypothetical protein